MKMSYCECWHADDPRTTPELPLTWLTENWTQRSAALWGTVAFSTQIIILLNTHPTYLFCVLDPVVVVFFLIHSV